MYSIVVDFEHVGPFDTKEQAEQFIEANVGFGYAVWVEAPQAYLNRINEELNRAG